jgi:drug/metabolite transporter (DMT)-like permease
MWFPLILASAFCWAWVSVLDSSLVRQYEKHPLILLWSQSFFTLPVLFFMLFFIDARTSWWPLLALGGILAYIGDNIFFLILDRIDASVSNASWSILAIFLSLAGFLFFGESWTVTQFLGAMLILGGAFFISFWHRHILSFRALGLLVGLAFFYMPYYILKKAALLHGLSVGTVFFWLLIGRELLAFSGAFVVPRLRNRAFALVKRVGFKFYLGAGLVILTFFLGEYFGTLAYKLGPVSLVAIVGNTQLFMVILFAWACQRFVPAYAPKELLDTHTVRIKLASFILVFAGLALLSVST